MTKDTNSIKREPATEIRLLTEHEAVAFWEMRLRALIEEPNAFSASYEEAVSKSIEDIIGLFREQWSEPDNYILGSFKNGLLTGMVGFSREKRVKLRHKGNIWGMYIVPETRGEGIARLLLTEVVRRARDLDGLEQIVLTVTSDREPAKKLYENLGFKSYGVEERALKIGLDYFDDILMVLPVKTNLFE